MVGKPLGILLATLACVRLRLCSLPRDVTLAGLLVAGCLGGIGFTMSIFIAALAFADEAHLLAAKLGILLGSAGAALLGLTLGVLTLRAPVRSADDAA
jgi:NhaA family Na+:H+ antiporter